jgi:vancomycin permeability regulator SanA
VRRRLRILLLIAVVPFALVAAANAVVVLDARGASAASLGSVPHAQAALVLGAQVKPDGTPSAMLADRIEAAAELYRAGKVDKLLLSRSSWSHSGSISPARCTPRTAPGSRRPATRPTGAPTGV